MSFKEELIKIAEQADKAQNINDHNEVIEQGEELKQKTSKKGDKRQVEEFLDKAYYNRGNAYYNLEYYSKAINDYSNAIHLNSNYAKTYNNRGITYSNLKDYPKAIQDYNKAIEIDPEFANAYNGRGNTYLELKNYSQAIEDFDTAIRLELNYVAPYYNRGNAHYYLKEYKKAIQDYNEAIRLDPNYTIAYNDRGVAYLELNDYKKAFKDYGTAIRLAPTLALPYNNRGNIYSNLKDYQKAINDYSNAIRLNPNYTGAYYNRGNAYYNLEDYSKAINDYSDAIRLNPNYTKAYYNRGTIYSELKDHQKAINDFDTVIRLAPNGAIAYYNRGNAHLAEKRYLEAINDFKETVKSTKKDIDQNSTQKNEARKFILTRKELYLTAQHEEFNDNNNSLFTGKLNDETLEPLLKLWQVVKEIKKDHEIGAQEILKLAHYTSLEILHKLLPRTKKEESRFRLNDARGMNDPKEGKRLIKEIDILKNFYNEKEQEPNSYTFIASFVKEKGENTEEGENALTMWRFYGKDAKGAKLTFPIQDSHRNYSTDSVQTNFSSNIFKKDSKAAKDSKTTKDSETTIAPSSLSMTIYKVKYEEIKNKNKISKILKSLDLNDSAIKEYVRYIMDEIRFLYKNEDYKLEEEYRIVWVVSNTNTKININEENNNLYMEVENNDFLFNDEESAVWIGTAVPRKELVRDIVRLNLRNMGYEDCNVKASTIEYVPSSK